MSKRLWVEVEFDDVDTDDLIDELETRYLNEREQALLLNIIEDNDPKTEFFNSVKDQYSLLELKEIFSEKSIVNISENQLTLFESK